MFKKVSVIGLGYIGLPTAALFASRKINVIGIDVNADVVETINRGQIHIIEPDLDGVVQAAVSRGYLRASLIPEEADAFLIAVPTPFKESHKPDLKYIKSACKAIAPVIKAGDLIVLESTSPVGTTEKISKWLSDERDDLIFPHQNNQNNNIHISYCPERVLPGKVMEELINNDRIIGGLTPQCSKLSIDLYQIFVRGECLITNARTAEMAKLTENSYRDVNIAFANELSMICDELDINVWELIELANRHPRVNILSPGPGVGGHCIAVDPWFIVAQSPDTSKLILTARTVNDYKTEYVIKKIQSQINELSKTLNRITVACFGLAFKADIDDLRESPALEITERLISQQDSNVVVVEPNIRKLPSALAGQSKLVTIEEAISIADIILILVDHEEFKNISDFNLENKIVIDTRGVLGR